MPTALPVAPTVWHRLSWNQPDLPMHVGRCLECGAVVTAEQWITEECEKKSPA